MFGKKKRSILAKCTDMELMDELDRRGAVRTYLDAGQTKELVARVPATVLVVFSENEDEEDN